MKSELIQVDDDVRIESGPAKLEGTADDDLMKRLAGHYKVGDRDMFGKVIVKDAPFHYLDWPGEPVWYVYKLTPESRKLTLPELAILEGKKELTPAESKARETGIVSFSRYIVVGEYQSRDEAIVAASKVRA